MKMVVGMMKTRRQIMVCRNTSLNSEEKECTLGTRMSSLVNMWYSVTDGTGFEKSY